ncbi:MAG: hypothetical protein EAZ89_19595 [Bacteroidetes bacterium]|nr:MAG: hypothetical protein EAZ89_19595 [Bacteroidota bacterium]
MAVLGLFVPLLAQSVQFRVSHFHNLPPASARSLHAIAQDSSGLVWLGSDEGLTTFDSRIYSIAYRKEAGNPVYDLVRIRGGMAALSRSELLLFPGGNESVHTDQLRHIRLPLAAGKGDRLLYDRQGAVWAAGQGYVLRCHQGRVGNFLPEEKSRIFLSEDPQGNILAASAEGRLYLWNAQAERFEALSGAPAAGWVRELSATGDGRWLLLGQSAFELLLSGENLSVRATLRACFGVQQACAWEPAGAIRFRNWGSMGRK